MLHVLHTQSSQTLNQFVIYQFCSRLASAGGPTLHSELWRLDDAVCNQLSHDLANKVPYTRPYFVTLLSSVAWTSSGELNGLR